MELLRTAYICLGMSSFHGRKYAEAEAALSEAITITWVLHAASETPQQLMDSLDFLVQLERQRLPALIPQGKWELYDKHMSGLFRARVDASAKFPLQYRIDVLLSLVDDLQSSAWNSLINPDETRAVHYCSLAFQLVKGMRELREHASSNHQQEINQRSTSVIEQLALISDREGLAKSFGLASPSEIILHLKRRANERAEKDPGLMYFAEVDTGGPAKQTRSFEHEKDPIVQIERLSDLAARGVLTEEEFLAKKAELLKQI